MTEEEELIADGWRKVPIVLHELDDHDELKYEPKIIGHCWVKGEGGVITFDQVLGKEVLIAVRHPKSDQVKFPITLELPIPDLFKKLQWALPDGPKSPTWTWTPELPPLEPGALEALRNQDYF